MLFFAESNGLTFVVLGILAAVVAVLLLRTQPFYRRDSSGDVTFEPFASQDGTALPHSASVPPQAVQGETRLREIAREISAELDGKISALAGLIREADRSAARLETALAAAAHGAPPLASPTRERSPAPRATDPPAHAALAGQAEGLLSVGAADRAAIPTAEDEPAGSRPAAPRRYEEIYALADSGCTAAEIAHRTGIPVGEVQLILSLRSVRKEAGEAN